MSNLLTTAQRTMAVFEVFARERRELTNSDMARYLSVPDSSCHDLLNTLHELGFLMRTPSTKRFYPTSRLFEIARQIAASDPITPIAREAVEQLTRSTGESAFFGVRDRSAVKVIAIQPGKHRLRFNMEVGERLALHASGFGKALLGLLPPHELRAEVRKLPLRKLTSTTITDPDRLIADIERGRKRGWYEARGEGTTGVTSLAVAGMLGDHPVALSLVGPSERMEANREAYVRALQDVGAATRDGSSAEPPAAAPVVRPGRAATGTGEAGRRRAQK